MIADLTPPSPITEAALLTKQSYFVDVQLWPLDTKLNVRGWLNNFNANERDHAIHLLNVFKYFSANLVEEMFVSNVSSLSSLVITSKKNIVRARNEWARFINSALFVRVTGEEPHDADSGYIFSRLARDRVGIPQERVVSPAVALSTAIVDPGRPLIFMDDFVGSGQQFVKTWTRGWLMVAGRRVSFAEQAALTPLLRAYYVPLIATNLGVRHILSQCQSVVVQPAHIIDGGYSVLGSQTALWPAHLRSSSEAFVRDASARAGIPDTDGNVNDWRGYKKLALALAFEHGPPDATIPLFYWSQNNWTPLVRRYGS